MAEATVLVCDVCGRPAVQSVTIRVGQRNWVKDLCSTHLSGLTAGARTPRPGRPRATVAKTPAKRRGRPRGTKSGAKRRGRPAKSAAKRANPSGNGRRKRKAAG
jgi:hypothetical protein